MHVVVHLLQRGREKWFMLNCVGKYTILNLKSKRELFPLTFDVGVMYDIYWLYVFQK